MADPAPAPAPAPAKKNIVVLGASYGGLSTTHYLLKHVVPALANPSEYQVVLVAPSSQVFSRPAAPRALISDKLLDQTKLFVDIDSVLKQYPEGSVRFLKGTATALDNAENVRTVTVMPQGEHITYHALVIGTGATTHCPLLSLTTDSDALRNTWTTFREALPNAKTIVIAGGGPAGIETAGELGHHLNGKAGWFKKSLENPKVSITVVTAADKILPILRPQIADKAEVLLSKVGVTVRKNASVKSIEPATSGTLENLVTNTVVTLEDGTTLNADIYIPATGYTYNTSFLPRDLLTPEGRVQTNGKTLRVDVAGPRVYAIGDVSSAHRPAVHHVFAAMPVLGNNIKRDLLLAEGKAEADVGADKEFTEDLREMQLVPIGRSTGVGSAMGFKVPGFMVRLIKGGDYFLWTTPRLWSGKQWAKP